MNLSAHIQSLRNRRQKLINGGINSIPSPFDRFKRDFIGITQGTYYLITAAPKSFKTQWSFYTFVYTPIMYYMHHPEQLRLKILYFNWEETEEVITNRFICHFLYEYSQGRIRIAAEDLLSTDSSKPVPEEILTLLEEDDYVKEAIQFFLNCVVFSSTSNPTGVYKEAVAFAGEHGKVLYKDQKVTDPVTHTVSTVKKFDRFEPDDPDLYVEVYTDHIGLATPEAGKNLRESLIKLSSDYYVKLRNRFNFTIVAIQQQAFEDMDNYKFNKLRPSVAGLADCKATSRDCNMILGLFCPIKYDLNEYMGYSINKFRNHIVFLECIVNRDGNSNDIIPLYVDGAVAEFREMPLPTDTVQINQIIDQIKHLETPVKKVGVLNYILGRFKK